MFRRNHSVHEPLDVITGRTPENIPYLIPEIVLLFKATTASPTDEADLYRCLPLIPDSRRA